MTARPDAWRDVCVPAGPAPGAPTASAPPATFEPEQSNSGAVYLYPDGRAVDLLYLYGWGREATTVTRVSAPGAVGNIPTAELAVLHGLLSVARSASAAELEKRGVAL